MINLHIYRFCNAIHTNTNLLYLLQLSISEDLQLFCSHALVSVHQRPVRTAGALGLFPSLGEEISSHVIIDFHFLVLLILSGFAMTAMLLLLSLQPSEKKFRETIAERRRQRGRDAVANRMRGRVGINAELECGRK